MADLVIVLHHSGGLRNSHIKMYSVEQVISSLQFSPVLKKVVLVRFSLTASGKEWTERQRFEGELFHKTGASEMLICYDVSDKKLQVNDRVR